MDKKLLAKNILCALGAGMIINLGASTTAYANENQNNYTSEKNVVSNDNLKQQQIEKIKLISQEISDINARLNQLTKELEQYNRQLNNTELDNNPQVDLDNIESFNENRKLAKKSKILEDNVQESKIIKTKQNNFSMSNVNSIPSKVESDEKKPIQITSKQIHQNDYNLEKKSSLNVKNDVGIRSDYITENRESEINNERKNLSMNYDESGFKINPYGVRNTMTTNDAQENISLNENGVGLKNDVINDVDETNGMNSFDVDNQSKLVISDIGENNKSVIDDIRQNIVLDTDRVDLKTDEMQNILNEKQNSFVRENKSSSILQQDEKKYISSVDINKNKNISNAKSKYNISIEQNEDTMLKDEDNIIDFKKIAMLERFNMPAPLWTYQYFNNLDEAGLLYPDKDFNLTNLSRREGAILVARSYNLYKIQSRRNKYVTNGNNNYNKDTIIVNDIDILMKEFSDEVKALGYNIISEVSDTDVSYTTDYDWKIGGEIRYNYAKNGGTPKYDWKESRLRARLYGKKALSDNWNINMMLETDHNFLGNEDNLYSKSDDVDIDLSRIYIDGQMNWWDIPFFIELGKTYAYLGEGNVLDSDFEGLKISANVNPNTIYSTGYGEVNDTEDMFYLEGYHKNKQYDYLVGFYRWNNYENPLNIYAFGINYYTGDFKLGGMYLKSDLADGSGAKDGYVLSARYKEVFPWIPHTYEFDLKYYNMAGNTYINHTMNGVGSYMNGFSGWGAMAYYTLAENWLLGLEYYDLKDKTTGEKGKTVWAQLSWYF